MGKHQEVRKLSTTPPENPKPPAGDHLAEPNSKVWQDEPADTDEEQEPEEPQGGDQPAVEPNSKVWQDEPADADARQED